MVAGIDESVGDAPDLSRLTQTSVASASGLALEVIDEHEHVGAALCPDLVFGAVAGEDDAVAVLGVDVGSDRVDREAGLAHDPDIDAAFVVAVHEHQVPVSRVEQIGVEPLQRRSILGFDDRDDVGIDAFGDHPGGHPGAGLVDGFLGQFDPADPTCSPRRR